MFAPSRRITRLWYKNGQYHALIWYVLLILLPETLISVCSFIPRPRRWQNWIIDNLSFLFLAIVMCTDQTSQILWQHHQGCPRGSWVLQGCLLWPWLPDIPQGKCLNEPLQKCGTVKQRILKNLCGYDLHRNLFLVSMLVLSWDFGHKCIED